MKPMRMCAACRTMKEQDKLVRIVRNCEDNKIDLDLNKKLFGRGMYVCGNIECARLLRKKRVIERNFKCKVNPEIYDEIETLIKEKVNG